MTRLDRYLADPIRRIGFSRLSKRRQAAVARTVADRGIRAAFSQQTGYVRKINPPKLHAKIYPYHAPRVPRIPLPRTPSDVEVRHRGARVVGDRPRYDKVHPEWMTDSQKRAAMKITADEWADRARAKADKRVGRRNVNPWWYH